MVDGPDTKTNTEGWSNPDQYLLKKEWIQWQDVFEDLGLSANQMNIMKAIVRNKHPDSAYDVEKVLWFAMRDWLYKTDKDYDDLIEMVKREKELRRK